MRRSTYTYRVEPNGAQRHRWALQQRAFSRVLPPSPSCARQHHRFVALAERGLCFARSTGTRTSCPPTVASIIHRKLGASRERRLRAGSASICAPAETRAQIASALASVVQQQPAWWATGSAVGHCKAPGGRAGGDSRATHGNGATGETTKQCGSAPTYRMSGAFSRDRLPNASSYRRSLRTRTFSDGPW